MLRCIQEKKLFPMQKKLQDKGARNVLVSMSGQGAVLADENGCVHMLRRPKEHWSMQ